MTLRELLIRDGCIRPRTTDPEITPPRPILSGPVFRTDDRGRRAAKRPPAHNSAHLRPDFDNRRYLETDR